MLLFQANGVEKAVPAGRAPEAADDLSRPHLSPLALLRAELCEAVAVHVCLDVPAHGKADEKSGGSGWGSNSPIPPSPQKYNRRGRWIARDATTTVHTHTRQVHKHETNNGKGWQT